MSLDANLLFWHGPPRPIDFDGSGWGYWMYDLAIAVAHCIGTSDHERFWAALLDGYAEYRCLPAAQLAQWNLFTVSFYVYYILWMVGGAHYHPELLDDHLERLMYRGAAYVLHYVQHDAQAVGEHK